jgi:hypothetical protein
LEVNEVNQLNTDGQRRVAASDASTPERPADQSHPALFLQATYATKSEETDVAIDHIVDHWAELRLKASTTTAIR